MGGGSLISGIGETLTKPVQVAELDVEEPTLVTTSRPAGNGSTASDAGVLVGSTVDGTVTGITHFGAFVNLDSGQSGLIHISEVAYEYVRDVREHLKMNERVRVKVLQVNPANGKYDLSLKQTQEAPAAPLGPPRWGNKKSRRDKVLAEGADPLFEEKLSKFLKSSEERLQDVKRNLESKRGGRFK